MWVTTILFSHLSVALFQSDVNDHLGVLQSHIWRPGQMHHLFCYYISASSCGIKVNQPNFLVQMLKGLLFLNQCVIDIDQMHLYCFY